VLGHAINSTAISFFDQLQINLLTAFLLNIYSAVVQKKIPSVTCRRRHAAVTVGKNLPLTEIYATPTASPIKARELKFSMQLRFGLD
jgi:hypothetical protein